MTFIRSHLSLLKADVGHINLQAKSDFNSFDCALKSFS